MSIITSMLRQMHGGFNQTGKHISRSEQARYLASFNKPDEYLKHATHRRDLQRWINLGMPDEPCVTARAKQRREIDRAERRKAHDRRYQIGREHTTGKSARRRKERQPQP